MNNTSFFSHLKHMKNLLVYGQEDYAARVCAYLDEITEKSLEYKCLTFLLQKEFFGHKEEIRPFNCQKC